MENKSFTLIELLVVIVIIGILAGVIMISTSSSIDKANITKLRVFEESIENNLAANMVSRWKLDEIIGTAAPYTTPDQWGNNTGTLYGANGLPQLRPASECITDGCFKFDGIDDYINCGNNKSLDITDAITISSWANISNLNDDMYRWIVRKGWSDASFFFGKNMYGKIVLVINNKSNVYLSTTAPDALPGWHHYVGTYDKNIGKIKIFIDGQNTEWEFLLSEKINTNTSIMAISGHPLGSSGQYFDGLIDDVRIYSTALSSSQIKQNYIVGLNSLLSKGIISKEEYIQKLKNLSQK